MQAAPGIRELGFRRWYERQLIVSHVHLVTCILCLLAVAALAETFSLRAPALQMLGTMLLMAASGALALLSWNRYRRILFAALAISEQSTCPGCSTYARFRIIDFGREREKEEEDPDAPAAGWLKVRCRECGRQWTIG